MIYTKKTLIINFIKKKLNLSDLALNQIFNLHKLKQIVFYLKIPNPK